MKSDCKCQYSGCKELADMIAPIKFKKQSFIIVCNKHFEQLQKQLKFKGKKIKVSSIERKMLRQFRGIKNASIFIELAEVTNGKTNKI